MDRSPRSTCCSETKTTSSLAPEPIESNHRNSKASLEIANYDLCWENVTLVRALLGLSLGLGLGCSATQSGQQSASSSRFETFAPGLPIDLTLEGLDGTNVEIARYR